MKCTSLGQYVRWKVEEIAIRRSFEKSGLNKPDGTPKRDFPLDYLDGFKGDKSEFLEILSPMHRKIIKKHKIPIYHFDQLAADFERATRPEYTELTKFITVCDTTTNRGSAG